MRLFRAFPAVVDPLPSFTWAAAQAVVAQYAGKAARITNVGVGAGSIWLSDGTNWHPIGPIMLARGGPLTLTGTTAETAMVNLTVLGGLMLAERRLALDLAGSWPGSTNAKTMRARHAAVSGITGTAYVSVTTSTATHLTGRATAIIKNDAAADQAGLPAAFSGGVGLSTGAMLSDTLNTAADTFINITGQLGSAAETLTLNWYALQLLP